jgi:hypothetical protein
MNKEPPCHCGESGYYHCSVLREKLREMRDVIKLIIETDCLPHHAYDPGDDDMSIYDLCKEALKWPDEPEEEEEP